MKPRHQLGELYPDLLGEQTDPNLEHLVQDLDAVYSAGAPPERLAKSLTIPDDIAGQARERRTTASRRFSLTRWMWRPTRAVA
ncbi:MAG TPA: hypothetical protein VFS96_07175, partial [Nitrolancea sp.]|nr:hypothetical protein [Nitrolancea sp.]